MAPRAALVVLALLVLLAAVGDRRGGFGELAVLGREVDDRVGFGFFAADVFGVDDQALVATEHGEGELGDRGVGDDFKGVADATALAGVDFAVEGDGDLAV